MERATGILQAANSPCTGPARTFNAVQTSKCIFSPFLQHTPKDRKVGGGILPALPFPDARLFYLFRGCYTYTLIMCIYIYIVYIYVSVHIVAYYTSQTLSAAFIPIAVWDPSESSRFKSTMGGSGSVQKSQSQRRPVPKTNSPWPESLGDINSQPFGEVYRERERETLWIIVSWLGLTDGMSWCQRTGRRIADLSPTIDRHPHHPSSLWQDSRLGWNCWCWQHPSYFETSFIR